MEITLAVSKGHQANNGDQYQEARVKIKEYRLELGLIKK
jgi:hypothetical protein